MQTNTNLIKWSQYNLDINDTFGAMGVLIEEIDNSLNNSASKSAHLDISVWFKSTKSISSTQHHLKINNQEVECKNIEITNEMINKDGINYNLFYFQSYEIERHIDKQNKNFIIELYDVEGFVMPFKLEISQCRDNLGNLKDIELAPLATYEISFFKDIPEKQPIKIASETKYFGKEYYFYSSYFKNNIFDEDKYILKSLVSEDGLFVFNFDSEKSLPMIDNDNVNILLKYEPITYKILFYSDDELYAETDSLQIAFPTTNPTKDGYSFKYWSFTPYGEEIKLENIPKDTDSTLYAVWEKECAIISYEDGIDNENIVVYNMPNQTDNQTAISNLIPYVKDTYIFKYWQEKEGEQIYYPGEKIPNISLNLKAIWDKPQYTVKYIYNVEDENGEISKKEVPPIEFGYNTGIVGKGLEENICEMYSYWSPIENDDNTMSAYLNGKKLPNCNITLYSLSETEFTIGYEVYGEEVVEDKIKLYNNSNTIYNYTLKSPLVYAKTVDGQMYYFNYWLYRYNNGKETINLQLFPTKTYNLKVSPFTPVYINLEAIYSTQDLIEHNIIINEEKGKISLLAENFVEDADKWKAFNKNGEAGMNPFVYDSNSEEFTVYSQKMYEHDMLNNATINCSTGDIYFYEYKQQKGLKKQFLELSLGFDEDGSPNLILLNIDNKDTENIDDDEDTILSLL